MKDKRDKKTDLYWISQARDTKKELLFELDTLLKGLDRYFYSENLSFSQDRDSINLNYYNQLCISKDVILRVIWVLETIMPENRRNLYWFQKFAESRLLDDHERDRYREALLKQDNPEESFFLLYDSIVQLKGLVSDLLKSSYIPYISFLNFGRIITKEVRNNVYFNPFKKMFNALFDGIDNPVITKIIRGIEDRELRKEISVFFLYLFRFLRHLRYVGVASRRGTSLSLSASILILILIRSEMNFFRNYIEAIEVEDEDLNFIIKSISYQLTIESKRAYMQELKDVFEKSDPELLRGKIENCHGILKNLFEQGIVQIVQHFSPNLRAEDIFESFSTKLMQSLKLREDIATLQFMVAKILSSPPDMEWRRKLFASLNNYIQYFESFTMGMLRYDDYEVFVKFFEEISLFDEFSVLEEKKTEHLFRKLDHFKIFLETTMHHLNNRTELTERPLEEDKITFLASQYL